ncbi:hypothetical protein [Helicobacter cinaedi]|nr:hypothetical protein [Helicobacter cinaedi]
MIFCFNAFIVSAAKDLGLNFKTKGAKMVGAGLQAGATLAVGIMNYDENKKKRKIAQGQLDLAKEQYQWEKDKYNTTLQNQTEAYNTLGDSFGKALEKESNANSPALTSSPTLSQGADSMASFAQGKEQSVAQDSSSTAPQMQKEQPLPTERM